MMYAVRSEKIIDRTGAKSKSVSDAATFETLELRVYEVGSGTQIPRVYHYHDVQEEAFYVLENGIHIETPSEDLVVEAGCFFTVPS